MSERTTLAPATLFYSYAHEDKTLRKRLETHLRLLHRQGLLSSWHDRAILPGADWAGDIDEHLNSANIILLLVSASYLASDYCYDLEMQRALQRHQRGETCVIPIILRSCDWSSAPFGRLQALPRNTQAITTWTNQDDAFAQIAQELRHLLDQRSLTSPTPMLPVSREKKQRPLLPIIIGLSLLFVFVGIGSLAYLFHTSAPEPASASTSTTFLPTNTPTITPTPTTPLTSLPVSDYPQLKDFYSGTATGYTNATVTFSLQSEDPQGKVKMQTSFQLTTNQLTAIYNCLGHVSQDNQLTLSCTEVGTPNFQLSIHGTIFADSHMEGRAEATDTSDFTYDHIYNWSVTPTIN